LLYISDNLSVIIKWSAHFGGHPGPALIPVIASRKIAGTWLKAPECSSLERDTSLLEEN